MELIDDQIGSHVEAVMNIYPEYPWKPYLFNITPEGYWDNPSNIKEARVLL